MLEAAHIKPYSAEGPHLVSNGLLLRSDLHRLFDQGYVTVTPNHRIKVSERLRIDYQNGRTYYPFDGKEVALPPVADQWPSPDFLLWHNRQCVPRMTSTLPRPAVVAHVDWGVGERKRWLVRGSARPDGHFFVEAPILVGPGEVLSVACGDTTSGSILAGFDFPIGLPRAYAERTGVSDFLALLPQLGQGVWREFFSFAERPEDVRIHRPFYPRRPGGTSRAHLEHGLGLSYRQLIRECERRTTDGRREACPLFWILGGQQVGRGACLGWQSVLQPAVRAEQTAIWPFAGDLAELVRRHRIVIVETYPAEFYGHLFHGGCLARLQAIGKRKRAGRAEVAQAMLEWPQRAGVLLDDALSGLIDTGFGDDASGEDQFDATVGCFGMLNVVLGLRPHAEPASDAARRVEGWIRPGTDELFRAVPALGVVTMVKTGAGVQVNGVPVEVSEPALLVRITGHTDRA